LYGDQLSFLLVAARGQAGRPLPGTARPLLGAVPGGAARRRVGVCDPALVCMAGAGIGQPGVVSDTER
ncbi:MAG: hypothetical protein ACP5JJ_12265, partial [Anaerolineae bacterium]